MTTDEVAGKLFLVDEEDGLDVVILLDGATLSVRTDRELLGTFDRSESAIERLPGDDRYRLLLGGDTVYFEPISPAHFQGALQVSKPEVPGHTVNAGHRAPSSIGTPWVKWAAGIVVLGLVGATAFFALGLGSSGSDDEVAALEERLKELESQVEQSRQSTTEASVEVATTSVVSSAPVTVLETTVTTSPSITAAPATTSPPATTAAQAPTTTQPPPPTTTTVAPVIRTTIANGTWLIGLDIQAGVWEAWPTLSSCLWARLSGPVFETANILEFGGASSGGNVSTASRVEVKPSDVAFHTDSCGAWNKVG